MFSESSRDSSINLDLASCLGCSVLIIAVETACAETD